MAASDRQLLRLIAPLVALALASAPAHAEIPARGWLTWMSNREAGRHEIYLMEVKQGTGDAEAAPARRLTFEGGNFPVWSPDGRWIAFHRSLSNSGHVIRRDGSGEKKICDGTPHFWMTDNSGVVCGKDATSGRSGAFYLVDPDSGASKLLFSRDDFKHLEGQSMQPGGITADGRWLSAWVFGRFKGGYAADNGVFDSQHSTVLLDLQDRSRIYYFGPGCLTTVAPQGDMVYHVSRAIAATMPDIIKMSVKDFATRASYELELGNTDDQWGHEYFPRISNDGKWLVYGASTGCHHWWDCDYEIFVHRIGASTTSRQRLTYHIENDSFPSLFVGALPAVPAPAADGGVAGAQDGGTGCAVSGAATGQIGPTGGLLLLLLTLGLARRARARERAPGRRRELGRWALLVALSMLLVACIEITTSPGSATTYHGAWSGPNVTLTIDRNQLVYRKRGGAFGSALIESSFRGLSGADIVYGYSNRRSRITVSAPPQQVGGVWKMTVEGTELVRRD